MRTRRWLSAIVSLFMVFSTLLGWGQRKASAAELNDPMITSPYDWQQYDGVQNVTLKWTSVSGAYKYEVSVRDMTDGRKIVGTDDGTDGGSGRGVDVSGTSYSISSSKLTAGHEYKVCINTKNKQGDRSAGVYVNFIINQKVLGTPEITSPYDGKVFEGVESIILKWNKVSGASKYEVSVRDMNDNKKIIGYDDSNDGGTGRGIDTSSTSYTISSSLLKPGHQYRVCINSKDSNGNKSLDSYLYFSINQKILQMPTITAPAADWLYQNPENITIRWNTVSGASKYEVYVRDNTENKKVIGSEDTPNGGRGKGVDVSGTNYSLSSSKLKAGHNYSIYISAKDNQGNRSPEAAINFGIKTAAAVKSWDIRYNSATKELEALIDASNTNNQSKYSLVVFDSDTNQPLYLEYDINSEIPLYGGDVQQYIGKYFRSWALESLNLSRGKTYKVGIRIDDSWSMDKLKTLKVPAVQGYAPISSQLAVDPQLDYLAQFASNQTGLDKQVILAQWISEKGWKNQMAEGYNFGNIRYYDAYKNSTAYIDMKDGILDGDFAEYLTPQAGAAAYIYAINNWKDFSPGYPGYDNIRAAAKEKNVQKQLKAIADSYWDAGHYQNGKLINSVYSSVKKIQGSTVSQGVSAIPAWTIQYNEETKEIEVFNLYLDAAKANAPKYNLVVYDEIGNEAYYAEYDDFSMIPLYLGQADSYKNKYYRSWTADYLCLTPGKTYKMGVKVEGLEIDKQALVSIYIPISNTTSVNNKLGYNDTVFYSQSDPAWGSTPYTTSQYLNYSRKEPSKYPRQTIANSGCALASFAMVATTLLGESNAVLPSDLVDFAVDGGYRTFNSGTYQTFIPAAAAKYGLKYKTTTSLSEVISALKGGKNDLPDIVIVSMGGLEDKKKGIFTRHGHYMVLTGVSADGKSIYINDPNIENDNNKYHEPHSGIYAAPASEVGSERLCFWIFKR